MTDPRYAEAIQESFIKKPLRTVLLIDDAFPTFSDLCSGTEERADKERAARLYAGFRNREMLCDVANDIESFEARHLTKSDLVVLDYHLDGGDQDNTKAIGLLRTFATSPHFNTVVVYTAAAEADLDNIWLTIIASLSGRWSGITENLDGEAKVHWERLSDSDTLPSTNDSAVMQFARRGSIDSVENDTLKDAMGELVALGVPRPYCKRIVEFEIAKRLSELVGVVPNPTEHAVGGYADGNRWVQVGSAFIVLMKKIAANDADAETAAIMDALNAALVSWRPSVVQVLISEIENALELEGLAGGDPLLMRPDTQIALTYYLLSELEPVDTTKDRDVRVAVMRLVDNVVDSLRRRLSSLGTLFDQVEKALKGDLRDTGWTPATWPKGGKLLTAASKLARTNGAKNNDVIFRLNNFLTTEMFKRAHLTTGTVFFDDVRSEYFVVASPACDLVAGQATPTQSWLTAISPMTPVIAILLHHQPNVATALSVASNADHIFLEIAGEPKVFKLHQGAGHQPSYEMFFAKNGGRVRNEEGRIVFDGHRIAVVYGADQQVEAAGGVKELDASKSDEVEQAPAAPPPQSEIAEGLATKQMSGDPQPKTAAVATKPMTLEPATQVAEAIPAAVTTFDESSQVPLTEEASESDHPGSEAEAATIDPTAQPTGERRLVDGTFEIVGQLRGVNGIHVLQMAGQHLSRIGLDFVSTPKG